MDTEELLEWQVHPPDAFCLPFELASIIGESITIATTAERRMAFNCMMENNAILVKNVRSERQKISQ